MKWYITSSAFLVALLALAFASKPVWEDNKLNVHVVSHSHDDVGWLKTVDQYYAGLNNSIQHASVEMTLETVMQSLLWNPERKFIFVEIAFFARWWIVQPEEKKKLVRMLVQEGRLEFINAGWCMNDEAATLYTATIDQMTTGHDFLMREFGVRPTVGWQIDPFGHSATQQQLFSRMGFDSMYFWRFDYQDRQLRMDEKRMEMIWRSSPNYKEEAQIFLGCLYYGYNPPPGVCFDAQHCSDDPVQDDPILFNYNVKERVETFMKGIRTQAASYKTNHIMLTMGSDFQYENAEEWFRNLDKLIKHTNEMHGDEVNVFYSTPSLYAKALNEVNTTWELKEDDFFPYADIPDGYWTGYFTSRPTQKHYARKMSALLQATRHFEVFAHASGVHDLPYTSLKFEQEVGVVQHHDSITGTEKQHVAYDYAKRLSLGEHQGRAIMNDAFAKSVFGSDSVEFTQCELMNVTICDATAQFDFTSDKKLGVAFYNPLARSRSSVVHLPVAEKGACKSYKVYEPAHDRAVDSQVTTFKEENALLPEVERSAGSNYALAFEVEAPGLGYNSYLIGCDEEGDLDLPVASSDTFIENDGLRVDFDSNGMMKSVSSKDGKKKVDLTQDFMYYFAYDVPGDQDSGAYIFRPLFDNASSVREGEGVVKFTVYKGAVVEEAHQTFSNWVTQIVRVYKNSYNVEVEYTVGPVPTEPHGREVITRFTSSIDSGKTVYTDSQGREFLKRVKDYRPTWKYQVTQPVSGNMYPVNTAMYIEDKNYRFSVVTDRSFAGASLNSGEMELLIHRRLTVDDGRGVGEPLNEPGLDGNGLRSRGRLYLVFSDVAENPMRSTRKMIDEAFLPVFPLFLKGDAMKVNVEDKNGHHPLPAASALVKDLPENVHLLTLKQVSEDTILLRLSHQYSAGEDKELSQPAHVDLSSIFSMLKVLRVEARSLTANQPLTEMLDNRMQWYVDGEDHPTPSTSHRDHDSDTVVMLQPMEIATFYVQVAPSHN